MVSALTNTRGTKQRMRSPGEYPGITQILRLAFLGEPKRREPRYGSYAQISIYGERNVSEYYQVILVINAVDIG